MSNTTKMSFDEFINNLNSNSVIKAEKNIYVEKNILSCYEDSKKTYRFKLNLNDCDCKTILDNSLNNSLMEESQRQSMSFNSEYISQSCSNNIGKNNKFLINEIINNNDYIGIQLYIGKKLLILFNINHNLIIISKFVGLCQNSRYYYDLHIQLVMKYDKLDLRKVKKEIEEINKSDLNDYILQKLFEDENVDSDRHYLIQFYNNNLKKKEINLNDSHISSESNQNNNNNTNNQNNNNQNNNNDNNTNNQNNNTSNNRNNNNINNNIKTLVENSSEKIENEENKRNIEQNNIRDNNEINDLKKTFRKGKVKISDSPEEEVSIEERNQALYQLNQINNRKKWKKIKAFFEYEDAFKFILDIQNKKQAIIFLVVLCVGLKLYKVCF